MKIFNLLVALLCLLFSLFISSSLQAQNIGNPPSWNWVKQIAGSGFDQGNDVVRDAANNVYVAGTFNGAFKIGSNQWQSFGLNNGFLAKFGPDGSLLWAKQIKSASQDGELTAQHLALDNSGNIIVAGVFKNGNLDIENTNLVLAGTSDHFVAKFSSTGSFVWAKSYGLPPSAQTLREVTADDSGNIYCLSSTQIIKYNSLGIIEWVQDNPSIYFSQSGDLAWGNGKLYLSGTFSISIQLGAETLTASNSGLFLCEVSLNTGVFSNGRVILESSTFPIGLNINALTFQSVNAIYVAGTFQEDVSFSTCQATSNISSQQKSFIASVGDSGCNWLVTESSAVSARNSVLDIGLDSDGNVWAVGDRNVGEIQFENTLLGGNSQGFSMKINASNGSVMQLVESPAFKKVATAGQDFFATGLLSFSAVFSKLSSTGSTLSETIFVGDGGYCVINALESDHTGAYFSANILGKVALGNTVIETTTASMLIGKISLDGSQLLWHRVIEGASGIYRYEGSSAAFLDKNNGSFYCIASFLRPITYNGQTYVPVNPDQSDYFVVRTGTDGSAGWLTVLADIEYLNNLHADNAGNVLVCGGFLDTVTFGGSTLTSKGDVDFFLAKLNSNGVVQWVKRGGGEDTEYAAMVSTDAQNNIYLAAECYSLQLDFNDEWSLLSNEGDGNMLFMKLTPNGTPVWEKLYGGDPNSLNEFRSYPYSIQTDAGGNSFVTGFFGKKNSFGNITLTSSYNFNNFVGKFDPNGDPIWMTPIKTRRVAINYYEIDTDELGNVYIGGQIGDSVFVAGNVLLRQGSSAASNFYLARFDGADGSLDWLKSMSGSPEAIGYPTSMSVHDHESILCGGMVIDRMKFDNTTLNTASGTNGFIGLLGKSITVSVQTPSKGEALLEISPNPAHDFTTLTTEKDIKGPLLLTLVNSQGAAVLQKELPSMTTKQTIDIGQVPAGIYFLQVRYGNTLETMRLVIR